MPYNIWCDGCKNHIGMGELRLLPLLTPPPTVLPCRRRAPSLPGPSTPGAPIRNTRGERHPIDQRVVGTSLQSSEEARLCHFLAGGPSAGDLVSVGLSLPSHKFRWYGRPMYVAYKVDSTQRT